MPDAIVIRHRESDFPDTNIIHLVPGDQWYYPNQGWMTVKSTQRSASRNPEDPRLPIILTAEETDWLGRPRQFIYRPGVLVRARLIPRGE